MFTITASKYKQILCHHRLQNTVNTTYVRVRVHVTYVQRQGISYSNVELPVSLHFIHSAALQRTTT